MPADPREYRAIVGLQAALQGISIGAGYHYDVKGTAVKLDPNQSVEELLGNLDSGEPGPRPFIVIEVNPELWEYPESHGGVRLTLPVTLHHLNESELASDADRMLTFYRGCADVEQAIGADPSLGNTVAVAKIGKRTFVVGENSGTRVYGQVDVNLLVRRDYGHPNE